MENAEGTSGGAISFSPRSLAVKKITRKQVFFLEKY
jgi:hypothetical protein